MKSLRRFFARLASLPQRRRPGDLGYGKRLKSTSLCRPPKIFAPVYRRSKRGAKPW